MTVDYPVALETANCPICHREFVLMAVIRGDDDNPEYVAVYVQARSRYCPFCGETEEGRGKG